MWGKGRRDQTAERVTQVIRRAGPGRAGPGRAGPGGAAEGSRRIGGLGRTVRLSRGVPEAEGSRRFGYRRVVPFRRPRGRGASETEGARPFRGRRGRCRRRRGGGRRGGGTWSWPRWSPRSSAALPYIFINYIILYYMILYYIILYRTILHILYILYWNRFQQRLVTPIFCSAAVSDYIISYHIILCVCERERERE